MATIDEELDSVFKNDKHRFMVNLFYTTAWIRKHSADFLEPFGISNPQFNIMRILRGAGDWLAMNTVKARMIEKSPNTTRLADKLLDKGLIERQRSDEDRRVVYIKITKVGLKLLEQIDKTEDPIMEEFMKRLTKKDAIEMSKKLDKLRG